jgi:hypothetical protein
MRSIEQSGTGCFAQRHAAESHALHATMIGAVVAGFSAFVGAMG